MEEITEEISLKEEQVKEVFNFFNLTARVFTVKEGMEAVKTWKQKMDFSVEVFICKDEDQVLLNSDSIKEPGVVPMFFLGNIGMIDSTIVFEEVFNDKEFFGGFSHHLAKEMKKGINLYFDLIR